MRFSKCSYLRTAFLPQALVTALCPCCREGGWDAGDDEGMNNYTVAWWCTRHCGFHAEVTYSVDFDPGPLDRLHFKLLSRGGKS